MIEMYMYKIYKQGKTEMCILLITAGACIFWSGQK